MATENFTVDAALLEELGERLIGRPEIALAELVKNSYDADATTCKVIFSDDKIEVIDDGHGMGHRDFTSFWLRLGTQHKVDRTTSPILGRPLTGSKGLGRLAAQFLAHSLELYTTAERQRARTVLATVDWRNIRRGDELASFPVEVVEGTERPAYPNHRRHGTRIVLTGLRKQWEAEDLERLGRELWMLRSPFRSQGAPTPERGALNFEVELEASDIENAQQQFDRIQRALTETVWKAKIHGSVRSGRASDRAEISIEFRSGYPENAPSQSYVDFVQLSKLPLQDRTEEPDEESDGRRAPLEEALLDEVDFTIFVYKLERQQPSGVSLEELRNYLKKFGNVSVYDAGFRLPYYGMDHDWLEIEQDQGRRISVSKLLPSKWKIDQRYMLDLPAPSRIFGHVEINTNHEARVARRLEASPGEFLLIQSGRDRLHPNPAHNQLRSLLRYAVDLYANRFKARSVRATEMGRGAETPSRKLSRVVQMLDRHKPSMPAKVHVEIRREATDAQKAARAVENQYEARAAVLAPLAAAGLTALALTHELARETRSLDRARGRLERLAREHGLPDVQEAADDLKLSLDRLRSLQSLFAPLLNPEDREGDSRLRVEPVVRQVVQAMRPLTPGLVVELDVNTDLRFPAGPYAAWNAVFQNIIANSWNAVLGAGEARIRVESGSDNTDSWIWVSDTGVGLNVSLSEADRLFEPFERELDVPSDQRSIAIGGQGMGLAIVRMICAGYGIEPAFVEAEEGFATTLQLLWKG